MLSKTFASILVASASIASVAAFTGDATWFNTGLGACGVVNTDADFIVALSPAEFGGKSRCFQRISASVNGRSVVATVVDLCPGCGSGSIDLSPAAFSQLADLSVGRLHGVNWNFI